MTTYEEAVKIWEGRMKIWSDWWSEYFYIRKGTRIEQFFHRLDLNLSDNDVALNCYMIYSSRAGANGDVGFFINKILGLFTKQEIYDYIPTIEELATMYGEQAAGEIVDILLQAAGISPMEAPIIRTTPVQLDFLTFFESNKSPTKQKDRTYSTRFAKQTTRFITYELHLSNNQADKDQTYMLEATYFSPNRNVLWKETQRITIKSEWTGCGHRDGIGYSTPGNWELGTYQVVVRMPEIPIMAEGTFTISDEQELTSEFTRNVRYHDPDPDEPLPVPPPAPPPPRS
jgi:hypothetical protein